MRSRLYSCVAVAMFICGCAPPIAPPPAVSPQPWSADEVETAAGLLALEDRRDFDVTAIGGASASPSARIRARAALAAGRIAPVDGRPFIRILLSDEDSIAAANAVFMAGQARDTASTELLATLLAAAAQRPTVAAEAAGALGKIGTERARQILASFLSEADTLDLALRPAVEEALLASWRAGEFAVTPFERWARHPDPRLRWRAAYALTRRPRPEAVPLVRPLLSDPEDLVRSLSLRALTQSLATAAGIDPASALAEVIAATQDPSYRVRVDALRVLATYDSPASVSALARFITEGPPHERVVAYESLARIGPRAISIAPTIRDQLGDAALPPHVREQAALALAAIDRPTFLALGVELARDPEWRVRSSVAEAAATAGPEALPLLRTLIRDLDPRVAARALTALAESPDVTFLSSLRPLLLESLFAQDVHLRAAALTALSKLADPSTFPALLDAYEAAQRDTENEAALAAIDAIADLRSASLNPERAFFARFTRHPDSLVRQRAVARFGSAAIAAWGLPLPLERSGSEGRYSAAVSALARPIPSRPRAVIESASGRLEIELFPEDAPLTVANFLSLARAGYFDGQEWPRVVPNFVVQGGDPRGDTSGGPGYSIRDELNRRRFGTGTVGMALSGPDTGGSQFFITHSPQPHLDGGYTVFGTLVSGFDVLERVLPGERIISVRIIHEESDE